MIIERSIIAQVLALRHELHRHPNLSNSEEETAQRIASFIASHRPDEIIDGLGGHGLAAIFNGKDDGPTIMLRCELDALPIHESNADSYRSVVDGVGHKCGHDGHMSIIAGMAPMLRKGELKRGRVILLFQPAEETGEGAARLLNDDRFLSLAPDYIVALHNLPGFSTGTILLRDGIIAAASRGMMIGLKGKTSHAAHPEDGRSPASALASIIAGLESIPSRSMFSDFVLCTVVHARLGERAFGVTPGEAEVLATLRAFRDDDMKTLMDQAEEIARHRSATEGVDITIDYTEVFPATVNDAGVVAAIERAAERAGQLVQRIETPFRWSEDFGHFSRIARTALFGIGSGIDHPQLHHSAYDFPDVILEPGLKVMRAVIDELIATHTSTSGL